LFDKIRTVEPGTIVENKRLSEVLAHVQAQQAAYLPNRRRHDVMRQRPPNNLRPGCRRSRRRYARPATTPCQTRHCRRSAVDRNRRPVHRSGWSDGRPRQLCSGMEHRRQARRLRRPAARLRGFTAEAPAEGVAAVPSTALSRSTRRRAICRARRKGCASRDLHGGCRCHQRRRRGRG